MFNSAMIKVRVGVERNYKDMNQMWTQNNNIRVLKVRRCPIAMVYLSSVLLLNMKTCIEKGHPTSSVVHSILNKF